ncbi:carboxypeptidase regulatory-like domain-containing protein [Pedobacter sp. V48]|uniref:carboxypeptidase regulatory-like domain-containing protein n=1 Tax=Pedobacter sp. V48 TaxID=509635 RepID=UPI0003E48F45|nr:carboxypeptidase regulatory-like domain-containing protein [Pedobacter sp. V48]ETZ21425.1 hypothetical protein N824_28575 [Pedobacter sp. V48]
MKTKAVHVITSIFICVLLNLFNISPSYSQVLPKQNLSQIIAKLNTQNDSLSIEKLYLQTDKPSYLAGDTLWFKAYLLNASFLTYSNKSGVLYLELSNDSNRLIQRIMVPVNHGMAYGYIGLGQDLMQGGYRLTGYTNWMRNFGERYLFKKHFYVSTDAGSEWLINYNAHLIKDSNKDKIEMGLKITQFDKAPVGLREMQLSVTDGRRTWFKDKVETSLDGALTLGFDLPEKTSTKNISLDVQDLRKSQGSRKISIPVILNRPEKVDLQFMPEGGKLVAGQQTNIAFKALNEDGYGAAVSGKIYNNKQQEITSFTTTHAGIGIFNLLPENTETYTARIQLPDGKYQTYQLPSVESSGITLNVNNRFKSDSCDIALTPTSDLIAADQTYYLIGMARNVVCWGAFVKFSKGQLKFTINKQVFPSGIVRLILVNENKIGLNERMFYNDHDDQLNIQLESDKSDYQQRDSISLNVKVTDNNGKPIQGSFSLAVTDNGQVKKDSIAEHSIVSYMLLTSDLKGNVEDPGYYDDAATHLEKWQHLNHLLMAQGWPGYDWGAVFKPAKPFVYPSEEEFLIKGKVTNAFNKPVAKSPITLFSKKPLLVLESITDDNGNFTFKGIAPIDTPAYFISAKSKRGKSFNVGIEMDEFKAPVFLPVTNSIVPWFVNIDTSTYLTVNNRVALKKEQLRVTGGNLLKEVVINAKKVIKDSKNLNGPGGADVIIDEEQLKKAGRTTLGDLLSKNVKGFGVRPDKTGQLHYRVHSMFVHLVIDGVNTEFFILPETPIYQYLKDIFDYYDAEEIKGIEVMVSGRYQMRYTSAYLKPMDIPWDHAFIEVTTRGGKGPFMKKSTGTYLYKPMPFITPKEFYSPKYAAGSITDMSDIRSTIYWAPNIITDKDGKATIGFYAADNPGTYTVLIEGADLQGHLGVRRKQIIVKKCQDCPAPLIAP